MQLSVIHKGKKELSTKSHEGPPSVTALPHRRGCGPAGRRLPPLGARAMARGAPRERGLHPMTSSHQRRSIGIRQNYAFRMHIFDLQSRPRQLLSQSVSLRGYLFLQPCSLRHSLATWTTCYTPPSRSSILRRPSKASTVRCRSSSVCTPEIRPPGQGRTSTPLQRNPARALC